MKPRPVLVCSRPWGDRPEPSCAEGQANTHSCAGALVNPPTIIAAAVVMAGSLMIFILTLNTQATGEMLHPIPRTKTKRDGARPSRCQCMSPHRLLLRGCRGGRSPGGGWSSSWRRVATRRRAARTTTALGRLLPFIKLLRGQDGLHLRRGFFTDGLHFGPAIFR